MPSDDTTPPVTKMNLTGRPSLVLHGRSVSGRRPPRGGAPGRDRPGCRPRPSRATVSTALMRKPCSSARSCSSDSACSSGVGASRGELEQELAAVDVQADVLARARPHPARGQRAGRTGWARARSTGRSPGGPSRPSPRSGSADRRGRARGRACPSGSTGRPRAGRRASAIISGASSGSSPCTLTTSSHVERRGDLRQRGRCRCDGRRRVIQARPPNASTASRTRSSSVATMTASTAGDAAARRYTCSIIGRPPISASGFAGETGRLVSRGDDGDVPCFSERVGVPAVPVRVHGES